VPRFENFGRSVEQLWNRPARRQQCSKVRRCPKLKSQNRFASIAAVRVTAGQRLRLLQSRRRRRRGEAESLKSEQSSQLVYTHPSAPTIDRRD